jgi:hypothetical protein
MHIEYRINESDYRNAHMLAQRKRSNFSALEYYTPYLFAIVWVGGSVVPGLFVDEQLDLLLTLGVLPIFMGFLWMRRKRLRREYAKQKNLQLLQQLDLDASGLRLVTSLDTTRSAWSLYSKFAEDKECFILFHKDDHGFIPISKDHLTILQVDELRALLLSRLPNK